jgi:hypothetical protein
VTEPWDEDDIWANESGPSAIQERKTARRESYANRQKSPTFGGVRDFTSALPVLIGLFCLSGLLAYYSISSKPGVVGWIGGAFFSFCAASLGFSVVRGAIRLIRSGNTQKPQAS